MWIATALLLSQYRYKMGRIKYFSLLGIPLIYYIFPFRELFRRCILPFVAVISSLFISLLYILIFSATKQVGALLFSLVFWTASSLVYNDQIRKSLLLSSIGIAILLWFPRNSTITISRLSTLRPYNRSIYSSRVIPTFCWDFYLSQTYISRF